MATAVRMYESEQQAEEAASKLAELGIGNNLMVLLKPAFGAEESSVRDAIAAGRLPGSQVNVATKALRDGRSILSVELPYGMGQRVEDILESCNPVDTEKLVDLPSSNPSPLSDFFGIPTLVSSGSSSTKLIDGPKERSLGFPLLTKGGRPIFGVKLKQFRKNSSMGLKLLTDGKPMFPVKLLKHR